MSKKQNDLFGDFVQVGKEENPTEETAIQPYRNNGKQIIAEEKPEFSLVSSPFTNMQVLHLFKKTPKKYVYNRKGKGGKWDYVAIGYVTKVLDFVFGHLWSHEIKEHGDQDGHIWVLGKLTINDLAGRPIIIKEQFGRSEVTMLKDGSGYLDYGNNLKAAASDSLKKCASMLGIAKDIYYPQEFKEIDYAKRSQIEADYKIKETQKANINKDKMDLIEGVK